MIESRYEQLIRQLDDLNRKLDTYDRDPEIASIQADIINIQSALQELTLNHSPYLRMVEPQVESSQQAAQTNYYAYLLEYVHDAIIATDADFTITFWNHSAEELYGWTAVEALGRKLNEVIHSDLLGSKVDSTLQSIMQQGRYRYDVAQTTRSGKRIFVDATGVVIHDKHGGIAGYLSATRDITARKQAEAQVERERARAEMLASETRQWAAELDAVFRALAEAVIVYDPNGLVIRANPAAVRIIGMDPVGMNRRDVVAQLNVQDEDDRPITADEMPASQAMKGEQVINRRLKLVNARGEQVYVSISASLLPYIDEHPVGVVSVWHNITQQVLSEQRQTLLLEENRRQNDLLEQMVAQTPAAIAFLEGPDHRYTQVNPSYLKIARGKGQVIGRTLAEVFPELKDAVVPILDHVYTTGEVYEAQDVRYTIEREGNKEVIYLSFSFLPLRAEQDQIKGIVILSNDNTERVRAVQVIEEERARLKAVFEYAPSGIVVTDSEGRIVLTNPEADRIYSRPVPYGQDKSAHATLEMCQPDGGLVDPRQLPLSRAALNGEVNINLEMAIRLPNGYLRPILVNSTPIRNRKGRIMGAVAVFQDITDRKRAEQQLRESEERFQVALKNSPISVYTTDRELRYTWVHNPPMGFSPHHLIGRRDDEIFSSAQSEMMMRFKQRVLESQRGERQEIMVHLNGMSYVFDMTAEPLFDAAGEVEGLTVAAVDVTEQRQLEEEMQRSTMRIQMQHYLTNQRELERMQIARDLHDGPLQDLIAVTFGMQAVLDEAEGTQLNEPLQEMQNEMQRQIANLRSFSYELRPPMLNNFSLERTIRSHAEGFIEKFPHLKVHLDLMPDHNRLPDAVRTALFRIYQESLNNVLKHSQTDTVYVRLEVGERVAQLEVLDKGVGFNVPADWLSLAQKGHLGLVGIQERVEAVGGRMKLASRPGHGTQLLVTIPYVPVVEE